MVFSRFRGRERQIGPPVYMLTELGKEEAETFRTDPRSRILTALAEKSHGTAQDVARATGIPERMVRRILKRMEGRYVTAA